MVWCHDLCVWGIHSDHILTYFPNLNLSRSTNTQSLHEIFSPQLTTITAIAQNLLSQINWITKQNIFASIRNMFRQQNQIFCTRTTQNVSKTFNLNTFANSLVASVESRLAVSRHIAQNHLLIRNQLSSFVSSFFCCDMPHAMGLSVCSFVEPCVM